VQFPGRVGKQKPKDLGAHARKNGGQNAQFMNGLYIRLNGCGSQEVCVCGGGGKKKLKS
jgi:hypothetical protein